MFVKSSLNDTPNRSPFSRRVGQFTPTAVFQEGSGDFLGFTKDMQAAVTRSLLQVVNWNITIFI
jgi:hypothetical protein